MISNPCTWFSGGGSASNLKQFTYEGGTTLYHFSSDMVDAPEFSHYQFINVVFFANDEKHAVNVLLRMIQFYYDCIIQQIKYYRGAKGRHHEEYDDRIVSGKKYVDLVFDALKDGTAVPTKAPTNQLYKVGWASNDDLF